MRHGLVAVFCLFLITPVLPAANLPSTEIDRAFVRLYNTDYQGAFVLLDRYITAQPEDPLGYALRAAGLMFSELDRLGILEGEFFADDKRIIEKKKLKPDPELRARLFEAIGNAQARGTKVLAADPGNQNALFSMAITYSLTMDYTALVEKKQLSSLSAAKSANNYAQRLLKVNPDFYDAYLTTGLTEYVVGSLPFFVRWFVRFENVQGSKETGVQKLELVARKGHYLRPFSKILLSIAYLRARNYEGARMMLEQLAKEFPGNRLVRKEMGRIAVLVRAGGA